MVVVWTIINYVNDKKNVLLIQAMHFKELITILTCISASISKISWSNFIALLDQREFNDIVASFTLCLSCSNQRGDSVAKLSNIIVAVVINNGTIKALMESNFMISVLVRKFAMAGGICVNSNRTPAAFDL